MILRSIFTMIIICVFTLGMVVQHNMNAINAYNRLNANVAGLKKASEKLSSGYRINRAGDDAAGLAISEKMRSQIKGLNQAVRNSQDGINMIQTFEGAAQGTHSILQRMKELATESANGTYDNPTDREAIQLEFDHLNDELNQIADTDFNGTVVLNGGEMADGLKVTKSTNDPLVGEFNYKEKAANEAAAAEEAKKLLGTAEHFCGDKDGVGKILDNTKYGKTDADAIWDKLGLEVTSADITKPDELQITFTYDGSKWQATGVVDGAGKAVEVSKEDLAKLTTTAVDATGDATGKGGFKIDGTSLNLVFDTYNVQKFDTATIKVQNVKSATYAPANGGVLEDEWQKGLDGATYTTCTAADIDTKPSVTFSIADDDMDANMVKALDALKTIELTWGSAAGFTTVNNTTAVTGYTLAVDADGTIKFNKTGGADVTIGKITAPALSATAAAGSTVTGLKFKLNLDSYNFTDDSKLKANSVALPDASKPTVDMFDAASKSGGVSKADGFGQSNAIMNYAEHIVLQTGARTKDAVDFNFNYNQKGTADMGDLKANLNLSARKDGLNTENLSLANAKDANAAIDQIDKAINKTSLVRASFGAIQNRLEHKITNLTTTSENLTEAESSVRDTDMASEMMNYTKFNILQQAAQSMLAQANQQPQSILQLLG